MPRWFRPKPPPEQPASVGAQAETAAEQWLCERGLRVVARNWRCKAGELDRVMLDGDVLVFVEVRQRSRSDFGGAGASITASKQRRLILAAQWYLQQHPQHQRRACRFDVMLGGAANEWTWLRNAFA